MIDFISNIAQSNDDDGDLSIDEQKILKDTVKSVLLLIMENELTQQQRVCLNLFYVHNKTQAEIARQLKISQPTVCRHIKSGKMVINKIMQYCVYSIRSANAKWIKYGL